MKIEIKLPPDPDRNRAKSVDFERTEAVRTLPREGAAKIKIKSVLKYSWEGCCAKGRYKTTSKKSPIWGVEATSKLPYVTQ